MLPNEAATTHRGPWWWLLVWVAAAAAITAGSLAAASGGSTAADDVAAIRRFVDEHPAFRSTTVAGSVRTEDERSDARHVHSTTSVDGEPGFESIGIDDASYVRLPGKHQWVASAGTPAGGGGWLNYAPKSGIALGAAAMPSLGLLRQGLEFERDGDTRLRAWYRLGDTVHLDPSVVPERQRAPLQAYLDTEVEVTVEHTGPRLDAITTVSDGERSLTRYRDWGAAITIAAPTDIDRTPDVEEDELAAFGPEAALVPTDLPLGWALSAAFVDGQGSCPTATFDYATADGSVVGTVVTVSSACADFDPADTDFVDEIAYTDSDMEVTTTQRSGNGWVIIVGPDEATVRQLVRSLRPYQP